MRAREFIFEDYKDAKKEFSRVADPAVVQTTIDQYKQLVNRNQFRNPAEKNIDHWRGRGWEAFSQMVKLKSSDITDTQRKRGKVVGNAITLQDDDEWAVVIPLDKEASVHYGKGTEWCTTKPHQPEFEKYVYERNITLIYAIDKTRSGRSVAISIEPKIYTRMFNQRDNPIDATNYTEISGLNPEKFIQMAKLPENQRQLNASREKYKVADRTVKNLLSSTPLDPEAIERELKITKKGVDCYNYIVKYGQEQNKSVNVHPIILAAAAGYVEVTTPRKLSPIIGQYIDFPALPAGIVKTILRSSPHLFLRNFKLLSAEQQAMFALTPASAYYYADYILNRKPFPAGEPAISANNDIADNYTRYIIKYHHSDTWENLIKNNAEQSYNYAVLVLDAPFPAGEPAIAESTEWAFRYTNDVLKNHQSKTWENLIKNDAKKSFAYVTIRHEPFPAGEAAIATIPRLASQYDQLFGTNLSQR